MYAGGVLGPDGSIHFVPHDANVGQCISVTGVVSTYALAITGADQSWGGILNQNSELLIINHDAGALQKISLTPDINFSTGILAHPFFNKL